MAEGSIIIAYGYSGSPRQPTPPFPDGVDHDQSFQMAARTLAAVLRKWFRARDIDVKVVQAWSKDGLLRALEEATAPIHQVHVFCHGDATRLSLAYKFDGGQRLGERVLRFNAMKDKSDEERAYAQWEAEDAVMVGLLSRSLDPDRLARLRAMHAENASWQIWGCYAGYETTKLGTSSDETMNAYSRRFTLGQPIVDGIAVDIAKSLNLVCTAAKGKGGLEFWVLDKQTHRVRKARMTPPDPAAEPYWLWSTGQSEWVSYNAKGEHMNEVVLFQWAWDPKDLKVMKLNEATGQMEHTGEPPPWFVDGYSQQSADPPRA